MFKIFNSDLKIYILITIFGSLLYIPFIGNIPLFDWDEINFAECAREMLLSKNYSDVQLYFQPFWEKPPLFIWLQALSMNLFGINEFAARFPNALCGVITLLILYRVGKISNDVKFGMTWVFVYAATLLPHLFFKSGIIDPWFNLFIFLAVFNLIKHTYNPIGKDGYKTSISAGFFLGLALLTKGPVALLLVGLSVIIFFIYNKLKKISKFKYLLAFTISFLATGLSWFIVELIKGNGHVIVEFINYQIRLLKTEDSDHGGPFIYHFVVLLFGCFPSSLFFLLAFKKQDSDSRFQLHFKHWMFVLFWVVLLLFSIVQTKIIHYSSLCYFPLTYIATYSITKLKLGSVKWTIALNALSYFVVFIFGIAFIAIGLFPYLKDFLINSNLIDDVFAIENLKAKVSWSGFEFLIGLFFIVLGFISIFNINNRKYKFIHVLFACSLITIEALLMFIVPKIEKYTQHSAINFYKICSKNNYSIESLRFKSYGTLFYGRFQLENKNDENFLKYTKEHEEENKKLGLNIKFSFSRFYTDYLLGGKITKPACFVSKINEFENLKQIYPSLKVLYQENGFCYFVRLPNSN
jgi:4-amino-4-deoxy-L-arabinose transferase-like glycosyltransferase